MKRKHHSAFHFVVCISNKNYPASLEKRKIYRAIHDQKAEGQNFLKVIDESGEDYLYPKSFFVAVKLPQQIVNRVLVRLTRRSSGRGKRRRAA